MTLEQQVHEAIALGWSHTGRVLDVGLAESIAQEVIKTFTPTRDPGHGHGTND